MALDDTLIGIENLNSGYLTHRILDPQILEKYLEAVEDDLEETAPEFEPVFTSVYQYYGNSLISFTNTINDLLLRLPILTLPLLTHLAPLKSLITLYINIHKITFFPSTQYAYIYIIYIYIYIYILYIYIYIYIYIYMIAYLYVSCVTRINLEKHIYVTCTECDMRAAVATCSLQCRSYHDAHGHQLRGTAVLWKQY